MATEGGGVRGEMPASATKQQFLEYVRRTHLPEAKTRVFQNHYDSIHRELERIGSWRPDARFLDVGCGLGLYAEFWHGRGFRVTGVDRDADLIEQARVRAAAGRLPVRYEVGDAERLPFEDGRFEVVYANSLLEHVADWEAAVNEWIRVLAPGGVLWIETTNVLCPRQGEFRWLPLYSWWPRCLKRLAVKAASGSVPALANYTPWPAIHWFSFFQLRAYLRGRGLTVRDRFDCLDAARVGAVKRRLRDLAVASDLTRWLAYLCVSPLVVLASKEAPTD